jgi:endonuclease-3
MATPSRTAQFAKLHKVLKKHYSAVAPDANRSVLEHLLFAGCAENATYSAAEEAFAALVHTFFDWNEIRVSSVRELSEVMSGLPDPAAAATRVKRVLQSAFEATYSFDLDELRKQNLGPAVERLEKIDGTTKYTVAYVVQAALGGHSIPIDSGAMGVLHLLDIATDEDAAAGIVHGLERAIAKNQGVEFGSLLHQLGADFVATPFAPAFHAILAEVDPSVKDRLPTRRVKRAPGEAAPAAPEKPAPVEDKTKKPAKPAKDGVKEEQPAGPKGAAKAAVDGAAKESVPHEKLSPKDAKHSAETKKKGAKKESSEPKAEEESQPPADKKPEGKGPEAKPAESKTPPADAEAGGRKHAHAAEPHEAAGKKKADPPAKKAPSKKKPAEEVHAGPTASAEGMGKRKPR